MNDIKYGLLAKEKKSKYNIWFYLQNFIFLEKLNINNWQVSTKLQFY